jgi:hypothetical protein
MATLSELREANKLRITFDHSFDGYAQVRLVKYGKQSEEDLWITRNTLGEFGFPVQAFSRCIGLSMTPRRTSSGKSKDKTENY